MSYDYELTEAQYNALPAFGKSNYDLHRTAKLVSSAPTADNAAYIQHFSDFAINLHTNQSIYYYPAAANAYNFYDSVKKMDLTTNFMNGYFSNAEWIGLTTWDPTIA